MGGRDIPAGQLTRAGGNGRASWRLITRLARRDIARHKARAVLVMLLIALPVAMVSGLGTIGQDESEGPEAQAQRVFGDAEVVVGPLDGWNGHCRQADLANAYCGEGSIDTVSARNVQRQKAALRSVSLPGDTLLPVRTAGATANWNGLKVSLTVVGADQIRLRTGRIELPEGAASMPGPGQIWIGRDVAQQYGWGVGRTVSIDGANYRVTGLVRAVGGSGPTVWVGPTHPLAAGGALSWFGTGTLPSPAEVDALNAEGLAVQERQSFMAIRPYGSTDDSQYILLVFAVGALAALVTATVAGAAFAIGARQQRRTLALLGATGADRKVLQRLVTRQGLLLGTIGSLVGAAAGVGAGNAYIAWQNAHSAYFPGALRVPLPITGGALAVGIVAALVSAWLPARTVARQDVLAGVRHAETASGPARFPRIGLVLVLVGAVVGVVSVVRFHATHLTLEDQEHTEDIFIPVIVCMVLIFVGVVASLSWLLDVAAGHRGGPLGVRFALRDLARNRGRGAACVAASMAVMALLAAVLTVGDSLEVAATRDYTAQLPIGMAVLSGTDAQFKPLSRDKTDAELAAVEEQLGPSARHVTEQKPIACDTDASQPGSQWCAPLLTAVVRSPHRTSSSQGMEEDEHGNRDYTQQTDVVVDDGSLYQLLTGRPAGQQVKAAMERGVVVLNRSFTEGGRSSVTVGGATAGKQVPFVLAPVQVAGTQVPALTSRAVAARLAGVAPGKLDTAGGQTWLRLPATPTQRQSDLINATIARETTAQSAFSYESGPDDTYRRALAWGTVAGAVLLIAVAVVVLALSLSDSRVSRQGLAAVGASGRDLRRITAVQALITVGIGHVVGCVVGGAPMALAVWGAGSSMALGIPWGCLAALALGVPVLVALVVRCLVPAARPVLRSRY